MPFSRQVAVLLPIVFFGSIVALVFPGRNSPPASATGADSAVMPSTAETTAIVPAPAPPLPPVVAEIPEPKGNWWSGKDDLLRRLEREKYFPVESGDAEEGEADSGKDPAQIAKAKGEFIFKEFQHWARRYHHEKDPAKRRLLLPEGMVRATIRRPHMIDLMRSDPKAALVAVLPLPLYASLPEELRPLVERPFSELVMIRPVESVATASAVLGHEIVFQGEAAPLVSALFGRREDCDLKVDCPAQGIRLGDVAVLRNEVLQALRGDEIAAAKTLFDPVLGNRDSERCFATGAALGPRRARALAAGRLFVFQDERTLHEFGSRIGDLDALPGEAAGSGVIFLPQASREAAGFDFALAERVWESRSGGE